MRVLLLKVVGTGACGWRGTAYSKLQLGFGEEQHWSFRLESESYDSGVFYLKKNHQQETIKEFR